MIPDPRWDELFGDAVETAAIFLGIFAISIIVILIAIVACGGDI